MDSSIQEDDLIRENASTKSDDIIEEPTASTKTTQKPVTRWRRVFNGILWYLEDQWFLGALGCLIAIASQYQVPTKHQAQKSTVVTYLCVSIIFFITGCTLSTKTLIQNYARWKLHLFVQVQCFLLTSALCFAIVSGCATNPKFMDPGLLIGLLFTGCVPTTISSNVVMTRQANGNVALTVVQSTLGNLLGPFLTPVLMYMYISGGKWYTKVLPAENGSFNEIYRRVFKQLGLSIFIPLVSPPSFPKPILLHRPLAIADSYPVHRAGCTESVPQANKQCFRQIQNQQNGVGLSSRHHMEYIRPSLQQQRLHVRKAEQHNFRRLHQHSLIHPAPLHLFRAINALATKGRHNFCVLLCARKDPGDGRASRTCNVCWAIGAIREQDTDPSGNLSGATACGWEPIDYFLPILDYTTRGCS
jgi:hypothetical protein